MRFWQYCTVFEKKSCILNILPCILVSVCLARVLSGRAQPGSPAWPARPGPARRPPGRPDQATGPLGGQLFLLIPEKNVGPNFFFNCQKKSWPPRGPGAWSGQPGGLLAGPGLAGQAGLARLGWPGQAGLARMTSHRALWPDRRENARGYPQNA